MDTITPFERFHTSLKGTCFFNAICDSLKKLNHDTNVYELKAKCFDYANNNIDRIKPKIIKFARALISNSDEITDANIWKAYLMFLKFAPNDIIKMANSTSMLEKMMYKQFIREEFLHICIGGVCGRNDIEGEILSEIFNVKICLIQMNEQENGIDYCQMNSDSDSSIIFLMEKDSNHYEAVCVSAIKENNTQKLKKIETNVVQIDKIIAELPKINISEPKQQQKKNELNDVNNIIVIGSNKENELPSNIINVTLSQTEQGKYMLYFK